MRHQRTHRRRDELARRRTSILLQALEPRQMLAAQLVDILDGDFYLRINATNADDEITIAQSGSTLTVIDNGVVSDWDANFVDYIQVSLYAGDDLLETYGPLTENMRVYAGDGVDTVYAGEGNDSVYGGWGDDRLYGRGGNDLMYGRDSAPWNSFIAPPSTDHDIISAHGGNDTAYGSEGNDNVFGDDGNDIVGGDAGDDYVYGASGSDVASGGNGNDRVFGQVGNDFVIGNSGNDSLYGNEDDDTLWGHDGNDLIYGHAGNDSVLAHSGADTVYGGELNDTVLGDTGEDQMYGESGNDDLRGGDHADFLFGQYGDDTLDGDAGDDWLIADQGDDSLYGDAGNDFLYGGHNDDTLQGSTGNDYLVGEDGNDLLVGSSDRDSLYGLAGADVLEGGSGDDYLDGGDHNDTLDGSTGDDQLLGQGGDDNLYGGADEDSLDGGSGNDGLYGGMDQDSLTGGSGADRFLEHTWLLFGIRFWGAVMTDWGAGDARLGFEDGQQRDFTFGGQTGTYTYEGGVWTESEVELIDSALAVLHHATGNDNLLERSDGSSLNLIRYGDLISATGGFTAAAVNMGSTIGFFDAGFDNSDDATRGHVFHEFGHNWDSEYDADGWEALSGWVNSNASPGPEWTQGGDDGGDWWYLIDHEDDFVGSYARTNPREDFAESFESYFRGVAGIDDNPAIDAIPAKKSFIEQMIDDLT